MMFRSAFVTIIVRPTGRRPWLARREPDRPADLDRHGTFLDDLAVDHEAITPAVWLPLAIPPKTSRPGASSSLSR